MYESLFLMIREPTNRLFASHYNFVQFRPVIEDRIEEIDTTLETFLDGFLGLRLEEAPGFRAVPVAWWDMGRGNSGISSAWRILGGIWSDDFIS
jgi:hypothetical protein